MEYEEGPVARPAPFLVLRCALACRDPGGTDICPACHVLPSQDGAVIGACPTAHAPSLICNSLFAGVIPMWLWPGLVSGVGLMRECAISGHRLWSGLWIGEGRASGWMPCYPSAFIANDMQKDHDKPDRIGNKDASAAFAQLFP
ncbi:hypothetical protein ACFSUK_31015 [Sphingobium scionense]